MSAYSYDLLVIGSGPAGQRAAIQAAKLNKRVALVERKAVIGGVCDRIADSRRSWSEPGRSRPHQRE